MKRIALIFLSVISIVACTTKEVPPEPPIPVDPTENNFSVKIHVPRGAASTYAGEFATLAENFIDTIYIDLYQGSNPNPINQTVFKRSEFLSKIVDDTVITVGYEVDNITTGALRVQVFANRREPDKLANNTGIATPVGNINTSFFMSGEGSIAQNGALYSGDVHLVRNVAKLRVNVSLNNVYLPSDLGINYSGIQVEVINTPDITPLFGNASSFPGVTYIKYPVRTSTATSAGQVDSVYLYENLTTYNSFSKTQIKITIPTTSPSEGNRSPSYTYDLYTQINGATPTDNIYRNYIYILNIKVRGPSLDPLITLDLEPWNEVNIDGGIIGTYLTTDVSEILFDGNGKATINFCTDAQAVYFSYANFNPPVNTVRIGTDIIPIGIEAADFNLAPTGYADGQILLDKKHCGSFSFQLDDIQNKFPGFPNINFSGSICMRAGNLVKCFTFPGTNLYDAHFIVGESLLGGESFTGASTSQDNGSPNWLQISRNRLYTGASSSITTGNGPVYLHLDENLSGVIRTGVVTLTNGSNSKRVNITQLPAIRVGRFGHTSLTSADSIFDAALYMEQLYEHVPMPIYLNSSGSPFTLTNSIYDGRRAAISVFDWSRYDNNPNYFDYENTLYQAINYCAQKNRISSNSNTDKESGLKWYLPSQAQLMGMWIANNLDPDTIVNSNFERLVSGNMRPADTYWSSTRNALYMNPAEAQYMNFDYGNVGHRLASQKYWARCVRDGGSSTTMVQPGSVINFNNGMPSSTFTTTSKNSTLITEKDETGTRNKTVFRNLQVANSDIATSGGSVPWAETHCNGSFEGFSNWRLPTQRELQAIWILQSELKQKNSSFNLLGNDYYWSQTESKEYPDNVWVVFGNRIVPGDSGNAPHRLKSEKSRVRCVREL